MKDNKKFFLGVFIGMIVMVLLAVGLVDLAFQNRNVRMLLFEPFLLRRLNLKSQVRSQELLLIGIR